MQFLRRFIRLPILLAMIGVCSVLFVAVAYAIGPHSERALTAVTGERRDVSLDLSPGAQRTEVYDSNGEKMGILRYDVDRELVTLATIPAEAIETFLAVEDDKFWLHNGVDLRATVRAMISNVAAGGINQGGSTITQQIVKLRVVGNEKSFNRKIREAVLASRLEEEFSKEEILEFYLNEIYFGNGAYGLQAAAETYFGKSADSLDVGDAAFLAGLIRSPSIFDGFQNIGMMSKRRSMSLQRAEDEAIINSEERAEYEQRALPDKNRSPQKTNDTLKRDYFLDEVTEALLKHPALGETYQERFAKVYGGGLRVWTTFDTSIQRAMEEARSNMFSVEGLAEEGWSLEQFEKLEVAMAAVEPSTGAVRAFLGGPEFSESQFNLATQGERQPGSSFKPYVLASAIETSGLVPYDTISGLGPCEFPNPPNVDYIVNNFNKSEGLVGSLEQMVLKSSNCGFVRLGLRTGLAEVAETADQILGRSSQDKFKPFISISLGAQEVTPLEQAVGYSVFANDGIRMEPYYISRIEDPKGELIYYHVPTGKRVLSENTAAWVTSALKSNVETGTGRRSQLENGQVSAGKTGTAQDFRDAWFVGYTPQLSAAVWIGNPKEMMSMGKFGTGGKLPATIWSSFMNEVLQDELLEPFTSPPPRQRTSQLVFVPSEICEVDIELGSERGAMKFELPCGMVRPDELSGKFVPHEDAVCRVTEAWSTEVFKHEYLPCALVSSRNPVVDPASLLDDETEEG